MKFTLNIECDNEAFTDQGEPSNEARGAQVALILRYAATHIENGSESRRLMDSNGNHVGEFAFSEDETP